MSACIEDGCCNPKVASMASVYEPQAVDDLESDIDYYISSCCQRNMYEELLIDLGPLMDLQAIVWFTWFDWWRWVEELLDICLCFHLRKLSTNHVIFFVGETCVGFTHVHSRMSLEWAEETTLYMYLEAILYLQSFTFEHIKEYGLEGRIYPCGL